MISFSNKKNYKKIKVIIIILILLGIIATFTYAYLDDFIGDGSTTDVRLNTATVDALIFSTGADITIGPVNQTNFANGAGNISGSTTASATLRANNTTNTATDKYNVYLKINTNEFVKTTNSAEILLSVTDPTGNTVTSLSGLTYTTVKGVSGFDVTEASGLIIIASDYTITVPNASSNPKTDTWNITLTFVNLDSDQFDNAGASFAANAIIQKNAYAEDIEYASCANPLVLNNYYLTCDKSLLACKVAKNFDSSDIWNSKVTLHNGIYLDESSSCAKLDAEDNSYRYSGGDYKVTQKAINAGYDYVNTYSGNTTVGVIGVNCDGTNQYVGYYSPNCSTSKYYYLLYDTNVTQYSTYDEAAAQAISDGYLEATNLNNFVCFGSTASTCSEDNLYRIIGAFDDDSDGVYNVKLIKADFSPTTELGTNTQNGTSAQSGTLTGSQYTGYKGNKSSVQGFSWCGISIGTNRWDKSTFRSSVLNDYYLNTYLSSTWKNKLVESTYYLGCIGKDAFTTYNPKKSYIAERDATAVYDTSTYPASINNYVGLMYGSDYEYASLANHWKNSNIVYSRASGIDWLYNGINEWTISPSPTSSNAARFVDNNGNFASSMASYGYGVRPVFYLDSSVEVVSGNGTKTNPYRIM